MIMSILQEYLEIIKNPAHTLVELSYIVVVDIILLGICWPLIKGHFHRDIKVAHEVLDEEHGVVHQEVKPISGSNVRVIHVNPVHELAKAVQIVNGGR